MLTSSPTVPVQRGCGTRKEGGIYAESGTGKNGLPLEFFIRDRIVPVDGDALGLSSIGVKLIKVRDVWHVFDIVGQEHYPNVTDYLEETRRYGMSRRLPGTLAYNLLTKESRIFLLHRRAYIRNFAAYYGVRDQPRPLWDSGRPDGYYWDFCPHDPDPDQTWGKWLAELSERKIGRHSLDGRFVVGKRATGDPEMCPGLWWEDLTIDDHHEETRTAWVARLRNSRDAAVHMPSFSYYGRKTPHGVTPQYALGVVAIMPITNLIVVEGGESEKAIGTLEDAGFVVGADGDRAAAESNDEDGRMPAFIVPR